MSKKLRQLALDISLDDRSKYLREMCIQTLESGKRAHLGSAMSIIEIIRVLYDDFLRFDTKKTDDYKRDRFILSKGHGCLAQYVLLADKGFFPKSELLKFCHLRSILGGHPEYGKIPGVEASTGSLGHGLSLGVGMALAARIQGRESRIIVVIGDGESNEGSIWEAALSASKHELSNLTVMIDYNGIQSYDYVSEVLPLEPFSEKWSSFGFSVQEINGHDVGCLQRTLSRLPLDMNKPTAIICHTVKGKGFPFAENNPFWHHKSNLTPEEIRGMYQSL